ncbi:MAG TPA: DinB family protein [Terriglobales bacterium]|nr:DinB family protein [Terriglobales bacterium]
MSPNIANVVDRYEKGIETFAQALQGVPAELLDKSPAPGKWSIRQIAVHLADSETLGVARFRTIAAQPGSVLKAYDQEAWAQKLTTQQSPQQALELFSLLRKTTAAMLRALPEAAWKNSGRHEESGEVVLDKFVEHYCDHVDNHSRQIREIRQKFGAPAAGA